MTTCKLSGIISPAFAAPHRAIKNGTHTQIVAKGGRGSAKSSWASVEGVLLILRNPDIHGIVLRKVANTLRTSVYAQYMWAITELGLYSKFKFTVSPMEMIYKPTGQKIMFWGMDDPGKLKSVKVPFGYIGYLHFEELDQFAGEEEIRNVEQSTLRGGPLAYEIMTFNPPRTRDNWANRYCEIEKPGQLIHTSTYLTTPREWLGERFLNDAEHLRETNELAYRHEYLGEAVGMGDDVFDNIVTRTLTDSQISKFDRIYQGVDWGWYPDPFAFIRLHYDAARETIYFIDECYANKQSNENSAQWIKLHKYHTTLTTCDNSEEKSVFDLRSLGVKADAAIKGPGSVEYGIKWLQCRKIVIDPKRTPNVYREFKKYKYERSRDGDIISGLPDKNNHTIDAARYALERVIRSSKTVA